MTQIYWDNVAPPTSSPGASIPQAAKASAVPGKTRFELIPPELEQALATVLTFGADKYEARDWEEHPRNWSESYGALRRHMAAWWGGEDSDPESGKPHLWHAAARIAFLITYEARGIGTDDRPGKQNHHTNKGKINV